MIKSTIITEKNYKEVEEAINKYLKEENEIIAGDAFIMCNRCEISVHDSADWLHIKLYIDNIQTGLFLTTYKHESIEYDEMGLSIIEL